jgi:D-galactonate transporter
MNLEPFSPTKGCAQVDNLSASFEDETYKKVSRRLVPFLILCYVIAYLDRVNVGFAKLQMLGDLGFSEAVYGLGAGVFFIGYFLFEVPSNLILHRVGAKFWIARIMVTWGVLSILMARVSTPEQYYLVRFLLGVAEAGFYPGIILYLTYWLPGARRARVLAMFQSAIPLSGILGGPFSGWILQNFDGAFATAGWQWLFMIEGLPAVLIGVAVYFYLDNEVATARWLNSEEKAVLSVAIAREETMKETGSVRGVFTDPRIWAMCVLVFGLLMGLYGISFWIPTLIRDAGIIDPTEIGTLSAVPNIVAIAGMLLFSRSSDFRRERRWHVTTAALLGAVGWLISASAGAHIGWVMLGLCIALTGVLSALPMQWSYTAAFLSGARLAAAIGVINSIGNLAGFVSSPLIGWLKDATHSAKAGMVVIALSALVSALVALSFPARLVNK